MLVALRHNPPPARTPAEFAARHGLDAKPRKRIRVEAKPVRPSAAIEAGYRKRLNALVEQMHRSVNYWLLAAYRQNEPEITQDESPAAGLRRAMRRLAVRWQRRFDQAARDLARYFAFEVARRSEAALHKTLREGGFSVKFKLTPAMNDVLQATVNENVALIRSIPQRYLTQVEGFVMRSVQTGRDLKQLSDDLQHEFGVTKRRAALISRDQNNKATANLQRARQLELGITHAVWVHSAGGKEPRPSHVKAGRERVVFDLREGWWDPHEKKHVLPGQLINCRCVARPLVPGFS